VFPVLKTGGLADTVTDRSLENCNAFTFPDSDVGHVTPFGFYGMPALWRFFIVFNELF
jgi:hypothetical protein